MRQGKYIYNITCEENNIISQLDPILVYKPHHHFCNNTVFAVDGGRWVFGNHLMVI